MKQVLAKILKRFAVITFIATMLIVAGLLIGFSLYSDRYYQIPAVNAPVPAPVYPQAGSMVNLAVRKQVSSLTLEEKKAFVRAVRQLKTTVPQGSEINLYDQFVLEHVLTMGYEWLDGSSGSAKVDPAHAFPAFLPWHRQFLRQFEQALQAIDPDVTIPYWDWTNPQELEMILQDDFLGPSGQGEIIEIPGAGRFEGGIVSSGPFADWTLNQQLHFDPVTEKSLGSKLKRFVGLPPCNQYPIPQAAIEQLFSVDNYEIFNALLEGATVLDQQNHFVEGWALHACIHSLIGGSLVEDLHPTEGTLQETQILGTMGGIPSSPYDPIFWLHHANVDRLWAEWQDQGHTGSNFYPAKAMPFGHNLHDPMWPWDGGLSRPGNFGPGEIVPLLSDIKLDRSRVTPEDVLNFRKLGYVYAPSVSQVSPS